MAANVRANHAEPTRCLRMSHFPSQPRGGLERVLFVRKHQFQLQPIQMNERRGLRCYMPQATAVMDWFVKMPLFNLDL